MTVVAFRLPYAAPENPFEIERSFVLQRLGSGDATAAFERRTVEDGSEKKGTARRFRKTFLAPGDPDAMTHVRVTREAQHVEIVVVFAAPDTGEPKTPRDASIETLRTLAPRRFLAANAATGGWLDRLPFDDGYTSFSPDDTVVAPLLAAYPGGRFLPFPWLFDVACSAILQQRVSFPDARRSFCALVDRVGVSDALGRAFPDPARLASLPSWQWIALGVDRQRASTLCALALEERRRPFLRSSTPLSELRQRLLAIPGIGPWTTEMIAGLGAGDPDALLTGDLHLPHIAAWAFARRSRGTDDDLRGFLAAYPGHRFRVASLLQMGKIHRHPIFAGFR